MPSTASFPPAHRAPAAPSSGDTAKPALDGLVVAVFGPDGSGKTSLIQAMRSELGERFRSIRCLHFRPSVGRPPNEAVTDPHRQPPRSAMACAGKAGYYWLDYAVGHLLVVRPVVKQRGLVIFDRYVHDMLVDPRRYRYPAPNWILRTLGRTVPAPDVSLILDAPVNVLQSRKQEVPPEESERQRQAYVDLARQLKNAHVLDASRPIGAVAAEAGHIILDHLGAKA